MLSTQNKTDFIALAAQSVFFVRLFFVCTRDPAINVARVQARFNEGGHTVPEDKIIARYGRALQQAKNLVTHVHRAYFYDNSADYDEPTLLFRTADGALNKRYADDLAPYAWSQEIYHALAPAS